MTWGSTRADRVRDAERLVLLDVLDRHAGIATPSEVVDDVLHQVAHDDLDVVDPDGLQACDVMPEDRDVPDRQQRLRVVGVERIDAGTFSR